MELQPMSDVAVKQFLGDCKCSTEKDIFDGDVIRVVYESQKAQKQGLEPDPKTYTGVLERVEENSRGEFFFGLGLVGERGGGYRTFNPSKGWVLKLEKIEAGHPS